MAQQVRQPLAVLDISLASGQHPRVLGIHQQQVKVSFEDVPDRLPVRAGALHSDMRHPVGGQPVCQSQEVFGHGAKGAHVLKGQGVWAGQEDAGCDRPFMHVQSTTARMNDLRYWIPG